MLAGEGGNITSGGGIVAVGIVLSYMGIRWRLRVVIETRDTSSSRYLERCCVRC